MTPQTTQRHVPDGLVLALACVAQFIVVLDVSIVNVALPSIGRDLHYSASGLQWVVNAYVLTFAGLLLFGGRAADLFGRRRVYLFGLGLFTLASLAGGLAQSPGWLSALVYAIIETSAHTWLSARTLSVLAVAVVLLTAFAVIESRLATVPLVPSGLLRSRWVTGANLVMLPVGAAFFSMWYFLSLYFQDVLGYSALRAGLAFIPMALAIIIGAQASPRLLPATGRRPLLAAALLLAAGGFAWLAQIPAHGSYAAHVLGPGCVVALAIGLLFTPLAGAATTGVPVSQAGLASGVLNSSRQIGGSVGLAALATVAVDRTRAALATSHGTASALTAGYDRAFTVAAVLSLAGLLCSLVIPAATAAPTAPVQEPQTLPQPERR